jgi:hypothetical protein
MDYLFSTINSRAASITKFINSKYSKSNKPQCIISNYRIWMRKNYGYSNEDQTELLSNDIFKTINSNLIRIKKFEDIQFTK